jgi:hypothetical protein
MPLRRILSDGTLEAVAAGGSTPSGTNLLNVRHIGSTRPSTSGWSTLDAWLDTTSGGSTLRLWDGAAFVPAEASPPSLGTLLFSDDFTGTDGAVWDAAKWGLGKAPSSGTGSGATLLAGAGVLQTSNTGAYAGAAVIARKATMTNAADVNALFRVKFDSTECFFAAYIRHTTDTVDGNNAYGFSASATLGKWSVTKQVGYVSTILGAEQTFAFTPGSWFWVRFSCIGTAIKAKVWADGASEPGSSPVDTTDATYGSAGRFGFRLGGGNPAVNARVFLDDLTLRAS